MCPVGLRYLTKKVCISVQVGSDSLSDLPLPSQRMVVWLGSLGSRALARVARSAGDQYAKPAAYLDEYDLANIPCVASMVLAMESPNSQFGGCPFHVSTCDACECGIGICRQQRTFRDGSSSVFGNCHLCFELQRFVFLRGGT